VARRAAVPTALAIAPFLGREAVSDGLLTRDQLRSSAWRRLYRGVYTDASLPLDHRLRCQGAGLILPAGGAIGLLSAAHLWDVRGVNPGPDVSAVVPLGGGLRSQPHLVVRRAQLPTSESTTLFGVPVTVPVRTAFDLARFLPRVDAVIALDAMLRQKKVSPNLLASYVEEHMWWPGIAVVRHVLSLTDALAESAMETRMRLVIVDGGLPRPTSQFKIFNGKRHVARVDFAYEEHKLALEYDGDHHRERSTFRFDMERLRELSLLGWRVLRFNADDVLRFPDTMLAQIRAALRRS
jgi:hypothetical protein